ncbi:MAG: heparinase II/III family protein [Cyclobacteriaceae bacterium]
MDAGTFVFDLEGVRWVLDPGNQRYYLLNKIGFNLAGHCQDCPRWTLLTKNNQGHSTITVNNADFDVAGQARIVDFKEGQQPEVTIDMTDLYFGNIHSVKRRFVKESDRSILVEDNIITNDSTQSITWGLMTQAEIRLTKDGAVLNQDGKELRLTVLDPKGLSLSVISLDPPPMGIDKTIENLKRIEIRMPAYILSERQGLIRVRMAMD